MKMMKKFGILCVLIFTTLAAQSASALYNLPYSTYGSENKWSGYKDYKQDNFDVRVVFNVYDIALGQFNWQGANPIPEGDQYIYTYQVINMGGQSNSNIGYFGLLDTGGNPIAQHLMHSTSSQSDGADSIAPDAAETDNQGEWGWSVTNGYVEAGNRSWFLIFSSDHAPTVGKFDIREGLKETEPPVPTPEPASMILFGSAACWIMARRNNKRRSS